MRAVDHVVERFPDQIVVVKRLYLHDEGFRSICDDLALAATSLRTFEQRPDAWLRPEVDDYRIVLRELEIELGTYLGDVGGNAGGGVGPD